MIPTLLLASLPALAMDVNVRVLPTKGDALAMQFHDVVLGQERVVEVPCALAKACRVSLLLTAEGEDAWRVSVKVEEQKRRILGRGEYALVVHPTFVTTTGTTAEMFMGGQMPIADGGTPVVIEYGLHVSALVYEAEG